MKFLQTAFLLVALSANNVASFEYEAEEVKEPSVRRRLGGCPDKPDGVSDECYAAVMPPWPVCLWGGKSVEDFIAKSKDSATRCCDGDIDTCSCPVKNTNKFKSKIDGWCEGVAKC